MNGINTDFLSIEQAAGIYLNKEIDKAQSAENREGPDFASILDQKSEARAQDLKFSKHASERLSKRDIKLSPEQVDRLHEGVLRAKDKRINESLVMMDNLAFIVSVKNNTVVTALKQDETDSVFTNIDGAVIV